MSTRTTGNPIRSPHSVVSGLALSESEAMSVHETAEEWPNKRDPYQMSNLTSNQLQVWIAQNLLPEMPIYNLAVALHLEDKIEPGHFYKAFRVSLF